MSRFFIFHTLSVINYQFILDYFYHSFSCKQISRNLLTGIVLKVKESIFLDALSDPADFSPLLPVFCQGTPSDRFPDIKTNINRGGKY